MLFHRSESILGPSSRAPTWPGLPPLTVVAADSLIKRDILRLPDPFAIVSVDGEQIHTTSVMKRTLNPYWNENFDMCVEERRPRLTAQHREGLECRCCADL